MLLAIDIGNTNIVAGVFDEEVLRASWRLTTESGRTADEYLVLLDGLLSRQRDPGAIDGMCISSVVPRLTSTFREIALRHYDVPVVVVSAAINTGLSVLADRPEEVGADRIANAVAAVELHRTPAIVVDFGTATTFDAVSGHRELLGSAIAPGFETAMEGLFSRAARLFSVELVPPAHAIGRNTVASVQSGAVFGYVGLVEGLVRRFRDEMGNEPYVIGTGGVVSRIAPSTEIFDVIDPELTLHGLRILFQRNA